MRLLDVDRRAKLTSLALSCLGSLGFGLLLASPAAGVAAGCALFFVLNGLVRLSKTVHRERYDPELGVVRGYYRPRPRRGRLSTRPLTETSSPEGHRVDPHGGARP